MQSYLGTEFSSPAVLLPSSWYEEREDSFIKGNLYFAFKSKGKGQRVLPVSAVS